MSFPAGIFGPQATGLPSFTTTDRAPSAAGGASSIFSGLGGAGGASSFLSGLGGAGGIAGLFGGGGVGAAAGLLGGGGGAAGGGPILEDIGGGGGSATSGGGTNEFGNIFIGSSQNKDNVNNGGILDKLADNPIQLGIVAAAVVLGLAIVRR